MIFDFKLKKLFQFIYMKALTLAPPCLLLPEKVNGTDFFSYFFPPLEGNNINM